MTPILLLGSFLLCLGFGGAAFEDWKTGKVDERWLMPSVLGALALLGASTFPAINLLFGAVLLAFAITAQHSRLMGGGDVGPVAMLGFSLGLWAPIALMVYVVGLAALLAKTKKKTGPAMPFLALGLLVGLMGMAST